MAKEMKLVLTDDFDGSTAAETVSFSLDQTNYEIELSHENAENLRNALAPYIERARRIVKPKASKRANSNVQRDSKLVRAWALENGHNISDRGRIPFEVLEAFDQAH